MSWTPTRQVINLAPIIGNIFQYLEDNQEDALVIAGNSSTPVITLAPFEKFFTSAIGRVNTVFPSLSLIKKDLASDTDNDVLQSVLNMTFEGVIAGGNTDEIVRNAIFYAMTVESLLTNIPSAVLTANSNVVEGVSIAPLSTEYDVLASLGSAYYQVFKTKVNYQLSASSY